MADETYNPHEIEPRWQALWADERAFEVPNPLPGTPEWDARSTYVLEMFPYPSGDLHMGHVENYTLGDVIAHFRRRNGFRVLHPMGWDAFGLPAENAAIKSGGHPREWTDAQHRAHQASSSGAWAGPIDWDREIATCEPEYYRWTSGSSCKLLERGLAYRKAVAGQLVPERARPCSPTSRSSTGAASAADARSSSAKLEQWFFRITDYAERAARRAGPARGLARAAS